jgi:hypothetical protein
VVLLVIAALALAWLLQWRQPDQGAANGPGVVFPPPAGQAVYSMDPVATAGEDGVPWVEADPGAFTELPPAWDQVANARLLRLDRRRMGEIDTGGELEIPIPQLNATFTVVAERVETKASGARSVRGHIEGDRRFGFVLTLGETSTFATIGTPQGIFNLAGNRELAWIVSQRELDRLLDPSRPDYVVIEPEGRRQ